MSTVACHSERGKGTAARLKYNACSLSSITTFTALGSQRSRRSLSGARRVPSSVAESRKQSSAPATAAESSSSSSPCTLTMISAEYRDAASATRSVPEANSPPDSTTSTPDSRAASPIRSSSVATMVASIPSTRQTLSTTCRISGRPATEASNFPGNLVEANRAGMMAMQSMRRPKISNCRRITPDQSRR